MLTIGSLFSGIGGLELGLERAGLGPVLWQAEMDDHCRATLRRHWPAPRLFRDVREVKRGRAERVDLICGGFPCQDVSNAGTRRGLEGARSGLWAEFRRAVEELGPSWVVIENVAALCRRGGADVLADLAALGFDASWDCVPAAAVGAPHRRDRFFLVAWRVSDPDREPLRERSERGPGRAQAADERHAVPRRVGDLLADSNVWRREVERLAGRQPGHEGSPWHQLDRCDLPVWPPASDDLRAWGRVPTEAQPALCGVAHGIPDRVDRLRALGNAVVPAVAEVIGRAIVASLGGAA